MEKTWLSDLGLHGESQTILFIKFGPMIIGPQLSEKIFPELFGMEWTCCNPTTLGGYST